jgi:hypothetical protein
MPPQQISLSIDEGRGELQDKVLTVPSRSNEVHTVLQPTWYGHVLSSAATPSLLNAAAVLTATEPEVLLALFSLGGLAGGLLAFWH